MTQLSPMQQQAAAELLRRALVLDSREDAAYIIDHLAALRSRGEDATSIMQWLTLLPKARGARSRITIRRTVTAIMPLPPHVQGALDGERGQWNSRHAARWLVDPDSPPPRDWPRQPNPGIAICSVEGCERAFEVNKIGRRSNKCSLHRRKPKHPPGEQETSS